MSLQQDFRRAFLESMPTNRDWADDSPHVDAFVQEILPVIPEGSVILMVLGDVLLLETGLLIIERSFTTKVKSSTFLPFDQLQSVNLADLQGVQRIEISRGGPKAENIVSWSHNQQHAIKFREALSQKMLESRNQRQSEMNAFEKIAQLKVLLDSGVLTEQEFNEKKSTLLGEI